MALAAPSGLSGVESGRGGKDGRATAMEQGATQAKTVPMNPAIQQGRLILIQPSRVISIPIAACHIDSILAGHRKIICTNGFLQRCHRGARKIRRDITHSQSRAAAKGRCSLM
jgi:hypothetical protein